MKLIMNNIDTQVIYEENEKYLKKIVDTTMHERLGVMEDGAQFSKAYKMGVWDGITDFYDMDNNQFPSGLIDQVASVLEELQNTHAFQFSIIDDRPDKFLDPTELDKEIKLNDNEIGSITLRDYQYDSVKAIAEEQVGIVNLATNAGKCVTADTMVLTSHGMMTIQSLFNHVWEPVDDVERVVDYKGSIRLVNRYGNLEKPSHLTVNGLRPIKAIQTSLGYQETVTGNHPMLVKGKEGNEWRKAEDLRTGDQIAILKGTEYYGDLSMCLDTAYELGGKLARGDKDTWTGLALTMTRNNKATQSSFMLGFLESETRVGRADTQDLRTLQLMLLNMGYSSEIVIGSDKLNNTVFYLQEEPNTITNLANDMIMETEGIGTVKKVELCYTTVTHVIDGGSALTYDVAMPNTHSFIANGMINHNTEVASGVIQQFLPTLAKGERIAFFTNSTAIFNQSAERISERLGGIKVGKYGGGSKDFRQVTCVMIPTLTASLKADPESGIKLSAKEQVVKKIAKNIAPNYENGINQRRLLEVYVKNNRPKTKADAKLLEELQMIYDTCGTDNQVKLKMRGYVAEYENIIKTKNAKVYKKYHEAVEFLESVAIMIVDEAHHTSSDTWYTSLRKCKNAQYRVALTGSIDKKNELLWQRMQAIFHKVVTRVSNNEMVERGISAKPTITMIPIKTIGKQDVNIVGEKDYQRVYQVGIVNNTYRNEFITKLTAKKYQEGKGILIIVNFVEHGDILSEQLTDLKVPHSFIHGEIEVEKREAELQRMKDGDLKVIIATSLIDEGVDISGINVLILGAGGKSLRQTLQRVGRVLRKKKVGENKADIYDFTDLTHEYLAKHSKERRATYRKESFDILDIGV